MSFHRRLTFFGLWVSAALMPLILPASSTSLERGEKQFSFTTSEASSFPAIPDDSPTAKYKEQAQYPKERPSNAPAGQAGQVGQSKQALSGKRVETDPGKVRDDIQPRQDSKTALKEGQSAGQVSNVPGTTSTSPNGTSNFYGTGGIPIFPEDIRTK
jgi:hypothetical protein